MVAYSPASLWRRFLAIFYDLLLILALMILFGFIGVALEALLSGSTSPQPAEGLLFATGVFLLPAVYFIAFWHYLGQTPGMRAWGIGLIDERGQCGNLKQCSLRYVLAILSWLLLGGGFWCSLWDIRRRCLHDRCSSLYLLHLPYRSSR